MDTFFKQFGVSWLVSMLLCFGWLIVRYLCGCERLGGLDLGVVAVLTVIGNLTVQWSWDKPWKKWREVECEFFLQGIDMNSVPVEIPLYATVENNRFFPHTKKFLNNIYNIVQGEGRSVLIGYDIESLRNYPYLQQEFLGKVKDKVNALIVNEYGYEFTKVTAKGYKSKNT